MLRFKNLGSGSTGNATVVEGHSSAQVHRLLAWQPHPGHALAARGRQPAKWMTTGGEDSLVKTHIHKQGRPQQA